MYHLHFIYNFLVIINYIIFESLYLIVKDMRPPFNIIKFYHNFFIILNQFLLYFIFFFLNIFYYLFKNRI